MKATRALDVVVIRARGDDTHDRALFSEEEYNSVQTVKLSEDATAADLEAAARIIDGAAIVFFAGGQQHRYLRWSNTALTDAVQRLIERGGGVAGTSAGLAILGGKVYRGNGDIVDGMFRFAPLANIITDTHFSERKRMSRLVQFVKTLFTRGKRDIVGIGVDEETAVLVSKDGTMQQYGRGQAWVVEPKDANRYRVHTIDSAHRSGSTKRKQPRPRVLREHEGRLNPDPYRKTARRTARRP